MLYQKKSSNLETRKDHLQLAVWRQFYNNLRGILLQAEDKVMPKKLICVKEEIFEPQNKEGYLFHWFL